LAFFWTDILRSKNLIIYTVALFFQKWKEYRKYKTTVMRPC